MFPLLTLPPPSPPICQRHHHHHHTFTVMSVNTPGQHPPNAHAIYTDMHTRNTLGPKPHPASSHSRLSEKISSPHASQKMNFSHNLNPKFETNGPAVVLTQLKQGTCTFYPVSFFSVVVFLLPLFTERRTHHQDSKYLVIFFRNPRLTQPYTTASLHFFFLSPSFNFHSFVSPPLPPSTPTPRQSPSYCCSSRCSCSSCCSFTPASRTWPWGMPG